jgi:hypothetical protein
VGGGSAGAAGGALAAAGDSAGFGNAAGSGVDFEQDSSAAAPTSARRGISDRMREM